MPKDSLRKHICGVESTKKRKLSCKFLNMKLLDLWVSWILIVSSSNLKPRFAKCLLNLGCAKPFLGEVLIDFPLHRLLELIHQQRSRWYCWWRKSPAKLHSWWDFYRYLKFIILYPMIRWIYITRWWFQRIFYFHPYLGKWSNLTCVYFAKFANGLIPPPTRFIFRSLAWSLLLEFFPVAA